MWRAGLAQGDDRGAQREHRDASWLDFSYAVDLSSDGRQLLLTDIGGGLSGLTGIALRAQGNPDPIVLGKGDALALAPDGRTLLAVSRDVSLDGRLTVLPVSAGSRRELEHPALQHVYEAAWFPDGARLALVAGPAATRARLFTWATTAGAEPRPLSAEGTFGRPVVSADGTVIAVAQGGMAPVLFTSGEGTARAIPGAQPGDEPLRFSLDGRVLFVRKAGDLPAQVDRVELATGSRTAWRSFQPADLAGVFGISSVVLAPDGQSYAYTFSSALGTLYLVEGVR